MLGKMPEAKSQQIWETVPWSHDVHLTRDLEDKTSVNKEAMLVSQPFITYRTCQLKHAELFAAVSKV